MDGFTVDFTALQAAGARLATAAADLDSVIGTWAGAAADGGSQFGVAECAAAFDTLFRDLSARLAAHKTDLDALTTAVTDSAGSYFSLDGLLASNYARVAS